MPLVDYCASCRRHVNGALSCPGCGTYFLTDSRSAGNSEPATAIPDEPAPVSAAVGGRAARRRNLAQLKKHKRRAATATVFALFGGGLTLAALPDNAPPGHPNAATAPQTVDPVGTPSSAAGPTPAHPVATSTQQQSVSASTQATTDRQPVAQGRSVAASSTQAVAPAGTQAGTRQASVRPAAPRAPRTTPTAPPSTAATPTSTPTTATTQPSSSTSSPATSSTTPPTLCLLGLVCVS